MFCGCLHIWKSSYLLKSLLTGFRREIPSVSPAEHSEAFLDISYGYTCSTLLEGKFLRWSSFSWSCKAWLSADSFPFAFPRVLLNAQVFVLSFRPAEWAALLHTLTTYLQRPTLAAFGGMNKEPATRWWRCVGVNYAVLRVPVVHLGEISRWGILIGLWLGFLPEST